MKNFLKKLLVNRPETQNKWWHRLFIVLLSSSAIFLLIITVGLAVNNGWSSWITERPTAFSLESNYQSAKGKELPCESTLNFNRSSSADALIVQCDGVYIAQADGLRYEQLYKVADANLKKQYGLSKYDATNCPESPAIDYLVCARKAFLDEQADPIYPAYQHSASELAHIKVVRYYDFGVLWSDILNWLFIPIYLILWVLFWDAVVYRTILYIIFGNKK